MFGLSIDELVSISTILSGLTALFALIVAFIVFIGERRMGQRQLILPLWDYLIEVNEIDITNPILVDVIKTVNTLELIGICYLKAIVDKKIIESTFMDQFVHHYEQINKCPEMDFGADVKKTGREVLKENPSAIKLYYKFKQK